MSIVDRGSEAMMANYPPRPLAIVRGEGCWLWDENGTRYLDLVAGIAVVTLGHGHPAPVAALAAQSAVLDHVSNLYWSEPAIALAERLNSISGFEQAFFCNSGAEANEAAIKLARRHGHETGGVDKHELVCLEGAFHGRTLGALQATWSPPKKIPFEPLPAGFRHVPRNDIPALRAAVGPQTAGVLIEPIQGEGGVQVVDEAFLVAARELCDQHGALLLFDEVQTGIGRCGAWFAFQRTSVRPDAISLAKGLASGMPIGALLSRRLTTGFQPGDHGTTFGGSPPIAAAALATIGVVERDDLIGNAQRIGALLTTALTAVPGVAEVRGAGLLIAVELVAGDAAGVTVAMREQGVIVNAVSETALRLCPPLVITAEQAALAVEALRTVLVARA
ncbi:MAG: acetylornithine transaminase [Thermoleophilia bacterium]|nr:acetylornithine transaminase [Thermoleophilia bacterium]